MVQRVEVVVCLSLVRKDIRMVQRLQSVRFNISTLSNNEVTQNGKN